MASTWSSVGFADTFSAKTKEVHPPGGEPLAFEGYLRQEDINREVISLASASSDEAMTPSDAHFIAAVGKQVTVSIVPRFRVTAILLLTL